ncbi:hypothetical protein CPB86DRAFT_788350 [Serendipita vermifera]|nr:hypothetical protein CPB86DRAFT_788350 [Serendipita vermifera]
MECSLIAVMGRIGAGKSSFVNKASGSKMEVGDGLKSCTAEVTRTTPFLVRGKYVILLDTPGFDDTCKSNYEVLQEIADYMTATYKQKVLLTGIVFLHSILDRRMTPATVRNIRVFENLCGEKPLKSVIMVTTMWEMLQGTELIQKGETREADLVKNPDFFGYALQEGATLMRHTDTQESSHSILSSLLIREDGRNTLAIQIEMVDDKLPLDKTSAAALIEDFDRIIENIQMKIEREKRVMPGETRRERRDKDASIKKMKARVRQLKERKENIGEGGSLLAHVVFLRWIKSLFS